MFTLSVVDISHNHLEEQEVLSVLTRMPKLVRLVHVLCKRGEGFQIELLSFKG